ncbi:Imm49 family immunity protein [Catenovulum sediminis]|uniref:Imm49 family immunity protein n=1 Tax=Catenovulum sediminis TaxID=1740262 RepID=UPI00163D8E89|nr:Imm49 family immunity protein [Catenovulum sediminis]
MHIKELLQPGLDKIESTLKLEESFRERTLEFIRTNTGDPLMCLRGVSTYHYGLAMRAWYYQKDIKQMRQQLYIAAKARVQAVNRGTIEINELDNRHMGHHLLPLLSNHPELIRWSIQRDNMVFEREGELLVNCYPDAYHYLSVTYMLALRGEFELVKKRCEFLQQNPSTQPNLIKYQPDYQFFMALVEGDEAEMTRYLNWLTSIEVAKERNFDDLFALEQNLFSVFGFLYTRLAWMHGYKIQVDSPWLPMEWIDTTPLAAEDYQDHYDFLQGYDIFTPWGNEYSAFTPRRPNEPLRDLSKFVDPYLQPKETHLAQNQQVIGYEPLPEGHMDQFKSMTPLVAQLYSKRAGFEMKPSKKAVAYLDVLLAEDDIKNIKTDTKVKLFGIFLGDAIIKEYGGAWVKAYNQEAIKIGDNFFTLPLNRIWRTCEEANSGSISQYFESIQQFV